MRSPAAFFFAASLFASLVVGSARAEDPPAATAVASPPPPAPVAAPPVRPAPGPHVAPYVAPYALPPPWWALPPPPTERRSKGMMITGITLFGAGGIVTAIGLGLFAIAESGPCDEPVEFGGPTPGGGPEDRRPRSAGHAGRRGEPIGTARQALDLCGEDSKVDVGLGIAAAGVLLAGVGVPLFVLGNTKVRDKHGNDSALAPSLRVGAGNAALRWSF